MKEKTIKKLKELKESINNMDYDTIRGLCEFITDDEIKDFGIIQEEFKKGGLDSLRYFINDTFNAYVYKINGYGNLENVNDDNFIYVIDELLERLGSEQ